MNGLDKGYQAQIKNEFLGILKKLKNFKSELRA
jgi:hypothetical protein